MVLNLLQGFFMNQIGFVKDNYISKNVEQDSSIIVPKDFRHAYFW